MMFRIVRVFFLAFLLLIGGCGVKEVGYMPKLEVSSFTEELVKVEKTDVLDLGCEFSAIEIYNWDRDEIKFEIKKRIQGSDTESILREQLDKLNIQIKQQEDRILFISAFNGNSKGISDKKMEIRIMKPKKIKQIHMALDVCTIKFIDDYSGLVEGELNRADIDINRLNGRIHLVGKMGNVQISNARLEGDSSIIQETGNISIKAEFITEGTSNFETDIGNINMQFLASTKLNIESKGNLVENEFASEDSPLHVKAISNMGKISIKKYE